MSAPTCSICGKSCAATDKNTDGTYAHAACLYATQTWPSPKVEKGGEARLTPS